MDPEAAHVDRPSPWSVAPLYFGFAASGVGVALPGALLPVLLARWRLADEQGGRLFLLAWIGSSLGALAIRGSLRRTLLLGSLGVAAGAAGMALSNGMGVDAWMFLYGFGLGSTMTSISLIRQRETAGSGTEMVRLNLMWAAGACVCPALTLRSLASNHFSPPLWGICVCFVLTGVAALLQPEMLLPGAKTSGGSVRATFSRIPASLIAMIALATGVEASGGAWLTTYAKRGGHPAAAAIAAPTCLWAGLLVSRLVWTLCARRLSEARIVLGSVLLMTAASLLLIVWQQEATMLIAAFCLGFGIGPTYPLLLGWALRLQRGGTIFFMAGVGSACLPWLTGVISTQQDSLRWGLTVPFAGSLLMLMLFALYRRAKEPLPRAFFDKA